MEGDYAHQEGANVLAYYDSLLYDAKCLKRRKTENGFNQYFIHYKGWKARWDQWVGEPDLLEVCEMNYDHQKRLRERFEIQHKQKLSCKRNKKSKTISSASSPIKKRGRPRKIVTEETILSSCSVKNKKTSITSRVKSLSQTKKGNIEEVAEQGCLFSEPGQAKKNNDEQVVRDDTAVSTVPDVSLKIISLPMDSNSSDGNDEILENLNDNEHCSSIFNELVIDSSSETTNLEIGNKEVLSLNEQLDTLRSVSSINVSMSRQFPSSDPAEWNLDFDTVEYLLKNPPLLNLTDIDFKSTKRLCEQNIIELPSDIFERHLLNGERKKRHWLLYSKSKNALYCFQCLIFASEKQTFSDPNNGFTNWKKCHDLVAEHEKSVAHNTNVHKWFLRITKNRVVIDHTFQEERQFKINYWKNVLRRIVATISFLSERGLAFRGDDENFGSKHNGNYLGCLELISNFDPFIKNHITNFEHKGHGNVSYLSNKICDEFISLMSKSVIDNIINKIKKSKYFSIVVDSTPDITEVDQLTIIIRYIEDNNYPVERFLGFLKSVGHKAEDLENTLLKFFTHHSINLKNCRGQSYDNVFNMSGVYNGLQARIKRISEQALNVPCATHSLNLIGQNAAEATSEGTHFFYYIQMIYNFFSGSTSRWEILEKFLDKNSDLLTKNNVCKTRWSSRYDVCKSLIKGYKEILKSLEEIYLDKTQRPAICHEAYSIYKEINSLEFSFLLSMWNPILKRFDSTSKTLQSENIDLSIVISLYRSLNDYIKNMKNSFHIYLEEAKIRCNSESFSLPTSKTKTRSTLRNKNLRLDKMNSTRIEKMKTETFLVIIDTIINQLDTRMEMYIEINNRFEFLLNLENETLDNIRIKGKQLVELYNLDLDTDFEEELIQFKSIVKDFPVEGKLSFALLHKLIITSYLETSFPNLEIMLRIICTLPSSKSIGERSFSVLKRVNNYLQSSLTHDKMSNMSILCIESDLVKNMKWEELIHTFATTKCSTNI